MGMAQLSFDIDISDERKAFELVYPELCDIIDNAPIDSGVLIFKEINNCSSVYFINSSKIFFQIRLRKKSRYLLLPKNCEEYLPDNVTVSRTKSDPGMIRILINSPKDILQHVSTLRKALSKLCRMYFEFGCCSRYEACSDAKACIHPDIKIALGCYYRRNLKDGRIFYGKNRNVD